MTMNIFGSFNSVADKVRDALATLAGDNRLDLSNIKNVNIGPHVRGNVDGKIGLGSATSIEWQKAKSLGISIYNGSDWEYINPTSAPTLANTADDIDGTPLAVDGVYNIFTEYVDSTSFNLVAGACSGSYGIDACYDFDGVYVHENSAAGLKRRFITTIYTYNNGGTVNFKDENNYRYISNYYNTELKLVVCQNNTAGQWSYGTNVNRESNDGSSQIKGKFVSCRSRNLLASGKWMITSSATGAAMTGCGFNSTTVLTGNWAWTPANNTQRQLPFFAPLSVPAGYNYITTIEKSDAGTANFESSSGAQGALYLQIPA